MSETEDSDYCTAWISCWVSLVPYGSFVGADIHLSSLDSESNWWERCRYRIQLYSIYGGSDDSDCGLIGHFNCIRRIANQFCQSQSCPDESLWKSSLLGHSIQLAFGHLDCDLPVIDGDWLANVTSLIASSTEKWSHLLALFDDSCHFHPLWIIAGVKPNWLWTHLQCEIILAFEGTELQLHLLKSVWEASLRRLPGWEASCSSVDA